jgi:hypothetical protein
MKPNTGFSWLLAIALAPLLYAADVAEPANGSVIAFSASHASYPGTNAFDGNDTSGQTPGRWLPLQSELPNVFVTWQFSTAPYVITSYRIKSQHFSTPNRSPDDFTLQGSNDNVAWTVVDTVVDESTGGSAWGTDEWRSFVVDSPGSYSYYKLVITGFHAGDTYGGIREIELHGATDPNWTPEHLTAGASLWLDAGDSSTITLNGSTVSQWDDKSGNARHVTQATAGNQPDYSSDIIAFNGTSDYLANNSAFMYDNGEADVYLIASVNSAADDRIVSEGFTGSNTPIYCIAETHNTDASRMCTLIRNDANSVRFNHNFLSAAGAFDNSAKLYMWRDTGTSVAGRVSGGTETSVAYTRSGVMSLNTFAVGALLRATPSVHAKVDIHELVITGNLSDDERQRMEGYLAWKWGLEASLPGGHPYESAAPSTIATVNFQEGVSPTAGYNHGAVYIRQTQAGTNQDSDPDTELIVGFTTNADEMRGLFEYDISSIPASSGINEVSLVLGTDGNGQSASITINLHEYDFDFDETTATWNAPAPGDGAGGTLGTLLTSATFDPSGAAGDITFPDSAAFQTAVSDALAADGVLRFIIARSDNSGSGNRFARFDDDAEPTTADRPELIITYTIGVDTTAPTIVSTDPADGATGLYVATDLVATFDEDISLTGAGTVTLKDTDDDSATVVINLPDAQVSASGTDLTINPGSNLDFNTNFAVQISADAIEDGSANAFAGIADTTTWNFTTAAQDLSAPVITNLSPADDSLNNSNTVNLVATFDDNLVVGSGNILIKNLDDVTTTSIDVTDNSQVTIAGNVLTIDPSAALLTGTHYAVQIPGTALKNFSDLAFAGISDDTTWNFHINPNATLVAYWPLNDGLDGAPVTTADDVIDDPTHPATDATAVNSSGQWFNDPTRGIVYKTFQGTRLSAGTQGITGDFTWSLWVMILGDNNGTIMGTRAGNPWNKLTTGGMGNWAGVGGLSLSTFTPWHHLAVRGTVNPGGTNQKVELFLDGILVGTDNATASLTFNGALQFGGNNSFSEDIEGLMSDIAIWDEALSTTRIQDLAGGADVQLDTTPPLVTTFDPADEAAAVPPGSNLVITFDDDVETATGDITIRNLTDATQTVISLPGPDADGFVSVVDNVLTINPTANLLPGKNYAVRIDAGAIKNVVGYNYAGIADDTTWNFTVGAPDTTAPTLASVNPANGATLVPVGSNLLATFDENVQLVTNGVISIKNITEGTQVDITLPDAQVSVFGAEVTINPSSDLDFGDVYAIQFDADAIDDTSGNSFAGILDDVTWSFTVDTPPVISSLSPADGAGGVAVRDNLVVTFNENVVLVPGGSVTIKNLTDSTALPISLANSQVTAAGANVTINLDSYLAPNKQYAIQISADAVADSNGHNFAGILDDVTWNFATSTDPNTSLVAYWPLNEGADGTVLNTADDVIDDPDHPATDATANNTGGTWFNDATRGIVYRTVQGNRLTAGTQGIFGEFTWSLWVKILGDNNGTIMGTRAGNPWNKLTPSGISNWANAGGVGLGTNTAWHHLAVRGTLNPGGNNLKVEIFKDGVLVGTDNASNTLTFNGALQLGGNSSFSEDIEALMSEVAIWAEALSTTRIQDLAAGGDVILRRPTVVRIR